jgi:hypothetical protein
LRGHFSFRLAFAVVKLSAWPGSLVIAFKAFNGDERLRGTALEYPETILPDEIRDAVWPCLGEERPRPARDASEILAGLKRSLPRPSTQR